MQYYYSDDAGLDEFYLDSSLLNHFKARREKLGNIVKISKLDGFVYQYEIIEFNRNKVKLKNIAKNDFKASKSGFRIALAMIELDSVYEIAPYLNELGLDELFLVYTDFSQKSYKFDEKKLNKLDVILKNSSAQCGRADVMKVYILKNLDELAKVSNFVLIDFSDECVNNFDKNILYLIGPEGGFSEKERAKYKKIGLKNNNILKAKTAAIAVVSKILI